MKFKLISLNVSEWVLLVRNCHSGWRYDSVSSITAAAVCDALIPPRLFHIQTSGHLRRHGIAMSL